MSITDVKSEISKQNELLKLCLKQDDVNEIDRQIKETEKFLNDNLNFIPTSYIIKDFKPLLKDGYPQEVSEEIWENLYKQRVWDYQITDHEEIVYERFSGGFGFFYYSGRVIYDYGYRGQSDDISDWYLCIREDNREKIKLTGAQVEIKLKVFKHFTDIIRKISNQGIDVLNQNEKEWNSTDDFPF